MKTPKVVAAVAAPRVPSPRWRLTLFRVLAALLGLVYLPGAILMIAPWAPSRMATALPNLSPLIWAWAKSAHPDLQRWAFAFSACVDEAIALILFYLAWRPLGRPLLLQFLALALVVALGANIPFIGPGIIVGYSPLLLLLVAYPEPRWLLTPIWRGRISWSLLALAVVVGAFFIPLVWRAFQAQVKGADELALNFAWASIVEHLCNLWLIAFFATSQQPGSTLLALVVTACLLYLGVAAISVPGNPGSWGLAGGAIAILGGAAYIAITAHKWQRGRHRQRDCRSARWGARFVRYSAFL